MNPPDAPPNSNLETVWDGEPIAFWAKVTYRCADLDVLNDYGVVTGRVSTYFLTNQSLTSTEATCLEDGSFRLPNPWPVCVSSKLD